MAGVASSAKKSTMTAAHPTADIDNFLANPHLDMFGEQTSPHESAAGAPASSRITTIRWHDDENHKNNNDIDTKLTPCAVQAGGKTSRLGSAGDSVRRNGVLGSSGERSMADFPKSILVR